VDNPRIVSRYLHSADNLVDFKLLAVSAYGFLFLIYLNKCYFIAIRKPQVYG